MRVQLQEVKEERFIFKETLNIDPAEIEGADIESLGPIEVEGEVSFADPHFLLRAHVQYQRTLLCDRCLEPTTDEMDSEIALIVAVDRNQGSGFKDELDEVELQEDDLNVVVLDGEVLETDPLVREHVVLDLPMKPLCSPDCQGLCPVCGEPLDQGCSCEQRETDPRWAALAGLKDQLS